MLTNAIFQIQILKHSLFVTIKEDAVEQKKKKKKKESETFIFDHNK